MLINLFAVISSSSGKQKLSEIIDNYSFTEKASHTINNLCAEVFPHAKLFTILDTGNPQKEDIISHLQKSLGTSMKQVLVGNISRLDNMLTCEENNIIILRFQQREFLESNLQYLWNSRVYILVIYISSLPIVQKPHLILPDKFVREYLNTAVLYISTCNMGNPIKFMVISYNPFVDMYYAQNVTSNTISSAKWIFNYAYSSLKLLNLHGYTFRVTTHCVNALPTKTTDNM